MKPVKKQIIVISIILIITLGFAVYGSSLNGKFVWDDEFLVRDNIYIKNWSCISKFFTENIGRGAGKEYHFYRPLQMITYTIDYSLWNLNPKGYHLTNIILHILAALLIYWLINILYDNRLLSLFTGILFVAHPIHTEAVSYISGRADSLSLIFMLISFILYIKHLHKDNKSAYILMLLTYISALLSRENSLILPVLLLLYHYTFKERFKIKQFLPILSIAIIYVLLRITVLKSMLTSLSCNTTLSQRIPGFFAAITDYIRLLCLPFNLHMEYGNKLFNFTHPKAIGGIIILLLLLIYAFKKRRNTNNLIFFSILWFFVTLLPQSNLYPINAYMAEHWLYLPSIGFFLILGNALNSLYTQKKTRILSICLIAGLVTFHSYLTIRQNNYWREPVTFYERTLRYAPDSPRMHNNLANIYRDMDKKDEAIALLKKAIAINPNLAESYYNLGNAYRDMDKKDLAIALYKKAIAINPNLADTYNNLGNLYRDMDKKDLAVALYKKAIEINPNLAETYYNLANIYFSIDKDRAVALYKKAVAINPDYADAYNNFANLYRDMNKKDLAIALYKKAIAINPNHAEAYSNLASLYGNMDKKDQAVALYKKAIAINPNFAEAHYNLGNLYRDIDKKEKAMESFKKAIAVNPNFAEAYYNLGNLYRDMDEKDQSIASFKKAIAIKPSYAKAYYNLAVVYYNDKQYDLALKHCDRAIELGYKVNPEFLRLLEPYRK